MMNLSIPEFKAYCRSEFLTNGDVRGEFFPVVVFGVRSIAAEALGFHVFCQSTGGVFSTVPVNALVQEGTIIESETLPLVDFLQLWDCPSNKIFVTVFDWLYLRKCQVRLKDNADYAGQYMMTFDWDADGFSDLPEERKVAHLIRLENGNFALQPNHRVLFHDSSLGTDWSKPPQWQAQTKRFVCENSGRWAAGEGHFYDIQSTET